MSIKGGLEIPYNFVFNPPVSLRLQHVYTLVLSLVEKDLFRSLPL
jgi:hypothetical protein